MTFIYCKYSEGRKNIERYIERCIEKIHEGIARARQKENKISQEYQKTKS